MTDVEAAQRSRDRIADARDRGAAPVYIPPPAWERPFTLYERAGVVEVWRQGIRFRAVCPCGWRARGDDRVRGEALAHGLRCTGAA